MTTYTTRYISSTVTDGDSIHYGDVSHTRYPSEDMQPITLIYLAVYSDYSGSAVERSNYRVLLDDPEIAPHLVTLTGSHGTCGLAYLGTAEDPPEWIRETLEHLESYCILDEDDESAMEGELEREAWADWGRKDFAHALVKMIDSLWPDNQVSIDDLVESPQLLSVWHDGCDVLNVNGGSGYQIEIGGGVHFYIDEWITSFARKQPGALSRDVETLAQRPVSTPVSE